jgi:excisionase family DNA binding protein
LSGRDRLLTVEEVADWLQVKPRTIYQWVHEGYIPVLKLGSLVRFDQASVANWLKKRQADGRTNRRTDVDLA